MECRLLLQCCLMRKRRKGLPSSVPESVVCLRANTEWRRVLTLLCLKRGMALVGFAHNLAMPGHADSPASLYTSQMRRKLRGHFLAGKFKLPTIREMEADV